MPVETIVTRCGNCGATLQPTPKAASLQCAYCGQTTFLAPTAHPTASLPALRPTPSRETATGDDPLDRVEQGPLRESLGRARRLAAHEAPLTDPMLAERALWPVGAEASSTYGGPWSPSTMLGPPRVFPNHGDLGGAWAPAPAESPVEWVELRFRGDVPVGAVRVYETHHAGSTYAIVDVSQGQQLLYAGPIERRDGAAVLEVLLDAPRVITALRVYVVNRGWTELDAVALLAASPLPATQRAAAPTSPPARSPLPVAVGLAVLAAIAVGVGLLTLRRGATGGTPRPPPVTATALSGASFRYTQAMPAALQARGVQWAAAVVESSTEFSATRNAATDALGPPDVYPSDGDHDGAWASLATDDGVEWITVRFAHPVTAGAVVWAETFNPGAVVRVDDVSDPAAPVTLWAGEAPRTTEAADFAELTMPAARSVSAVRLVLDTRRVAGWNEIDAIGLIPATP